MDPVTGTKKLTTDIVGIATHQARINVAMIARLLHRAQVVSICFVLDTTGSMASYISGVKDQILEIVRLTQASGCGVAGLAFVGYKDWCDGK